MGSSPEPGLRSSNWDSELGLFLVLERLQEGPDSPCAAPYIEKENERGRLKVQPAWPLSRKRMGLRSEACAGRASSLRRSLVKCQLRRDLRAQPKGRKNKGTAKTRKGSTIPGRKSRGRPKKLEKEEEEDISQVSSEEEPLAVPPAP